MSRKSKDARAHRVRDMLFDDGWKTPNTYCNQFAPIEQIPAVYLFMLVSKDTYDEEIVAYVGMSRQLKTRLSNHPMKSALVMPNYWKMVWFKPTPVEDLRSVEAGYIRKFNPPWNINGKKRGVILQ